MVNTRRAGPPQSRQAPRQGTDETGVKAAFSLLTSLAAVLLVLAPIGRDGAAEAACRLSVGWEPYAVYTFLDEQGDLTGADIELIEAIAQEIDCVLTFRELPWARVMLEIESGALDVATSASRSAEREAFAHFSEPYRSAEVAIYVRRGESDKHALADLRAIAQTGFRLGVIAGYHYGEEFAELMKDEAFAAQVDATVDYPTNLRKLLHGRIDGYLVDDVGVLVAEAKHLGITDQIERHPRRFAGEALHLIFSEKSVDPALVQAVNEAIRRLEADGRLKRIMQKYLE